jgi:hypothetical protein
VAWVIVFAAFALVEFDAFLRATSPERAAGYDFVSRLPMAVALWGRYLAMAFASYGVSAFHDSMVLSSSLDPWVVGGALGAVFVGVMAIRALRNRREEAAWWIWAVVAFLPVSQILPFRYPMGDRYLYPILPGLIGGTLLAAAGLLDRLRSGPLRLRQAAAVIAIVLIAALGVRSHGRATLWRQPVLLVADSAARYPDGIQAHLLRARRAANRGNAAAVARELRRAMERGFTRFEQVLADPALGPLRADPEVARVLADMAGHWVERYRGFEELSQAELMSLGAAHQVRGEREPARRAFERALERGGPFDQEIRQVLRSLDLPPDPRWGR